MKKLTIFLTFSLLFAFVLSACGGDAEVAVDTSADAEVSSDDAATGILPGPTTLDLDDPDAIQAIDTDYELHLVMSYSGTASDGSVLMGEFTLDQKQLIDSADSEILVQASGMADLGEVDMVSMSILGDTVYFYTDVNGCIYLPASSYDDPYNDVVFTGDSMNGEAVRVGSETINGVATYHFALDTYNIDPAEMDLNTLESGDMYVAQDGGYLVRMVMEGMGTNEFFGGDGSIPVDIHYQLDYTPADGIEIMVPEGCEVVEDSASGAGAGDSAANSEDYPVMADASNVTAFGTLFSYETNASIEEVMAYYKAELAADGWSLDQEIVGGETGILVFMQGGSGLSVAINGDPNNPGTLTVVIIKE